MDIREPTRMQTYLAMVREGSAWPAHSLPQTLDEYVAVGNATGLPFVFYQWGHKDAPGGDKTETFNLEIVDPDHDPESNEVIAACMRITNRTTGICEEINVGKRVKGGFVMQTLMKTTKVDDLAAYLDTQADLPRAYAPDPAHRHAKALSAVRLRMAAAGIGEEPALAIGEASPQPSLSSTGMRP
jgi:hypothetical protein